MTHARASEKNHANPVVSGLYCRLWRVVLLIVVLTAGCQDDSAPVEPTEGPHPESRPVAIIASGDTHGWIIPCGCTSNQSGGLLRRGTYVQSRRSEAVVVPVDVGGAADGTAPYQRERFHAILKGEAAMGLTVHNVGVAEAAFGPQALAQLSADTGVTFVSANCSQGNQNFGERFYVTSAEETGEVIVFVGVLSPKYAADELSVTDPGDAVLAVLDDLRESQQQYDRLVVLAYLPVDELRDLAESLPEADAVIGGPTGQALAPEKVGRTTVLSATNKGKFLAEVVFFAGQQRPSAAVIEMSTEFDDDKVQQTNLTSFRSLLEKRDFTAAESGLVDESILQLAGNHQISGTASCAACHDETNSHWDKSSHSHAWERLVNEGAQVDPYCQHCHTTGYGMADGFVSAKRSLQRTQVGCESCHGPSSAHVADSSVRTPFDAAGMCLKCHDPENSPHFEYDSYWEKIRHE